MISLLSVERPFFGCGTGLQEGKKLVSKTVALQQATLSVRQFCLRCVSAKSVRGRVSKSSESVQSQENETGGGSVSK